MATDEVQDALSKAWDVYQNAWNSHDTAYTQETGWRCACGWHKPLHHTSLRSVRQHVTMAHRKASKEHNARTSAILQP